MNTQRNEEKQNFWLREKRIAETNSEEKETENLHIAKMQWKRRDENLNS